MQPRVTAILVARNGEQWLPSTLAALAGQTRRPDDVVLVDAGSTDGSADLLTAAAPTRFVSAPAGSFGSAISVGLRSLAPVASPDEWLWLLTADTAPEPRALELLLGAVEVAPSVAIAGPKLVDPDDRGILLSYGETLSTLGATVPLVDGDLDQAQFDVEDDVLGVTSSAMLVRRSTWQALGGFDAGLPTADAGLDLSVRARLAGSRVIRVPDARVARAARPEDFGRRKPHSDRALARVRRAAQLHRRLAYAAGGAVPFIWLALVPLAVIRSIGHLLAKRPGLIGGELGSAFAAAFDGSVPSARSRLGESRSAGWAAIAPLRMPADEQRERRAARRELGTARDEEPELVRASFVTGGGAWIVLIAAVLGLGLFWRLVGVSLISGGALAPIGPDLGAVWGQLGIVGREGPVGLVGPADPFLAVVAVLGSITAWDPSLSLVLLWLAALPLAALGAWWCATRLSEKRWPPIVAAVLWMLAPPLLAGLDAGRPTAVLVHVLLPFLFLAAIEGARSWSAAATASLLFAAVVACAPVLAPALVVLVVAWAATHPRGIPRVLGILIPAAALFAPLAIAQVMRGTPLGLLADPGLTLPVAQPSGWQLLLGLPSSAADGWQLLSASVGLPVVWGALAPVVLLAPLAVVALLALFLPGASRAVPSVIVGLLGLITAVASAHLQVAAAGMDTVTPWPGTGLSLYWFGLLGAAVVALEALGKAALLTGLAVVVTASAAVLPLIAAAPLGTSSVAAGDARALPALVGAQADAHPGAGTLLLTAQEDGSLSATLVRGAGTTLDETSTLVATRSDVRGADAPLVELAANLASRSGYDPIPVLQQLQVAFVVVPAVTGGGAAVRQRTAEALDASPDLEPVGDTALWRFAALEPAAPEPVALGPVASAIPIGQAVIIGLALLLAIPTRRRRRTVRASGPLDEDPADTFDEDDNG